MPRRSPVEYGVSGVVYSIPAPGAIRDLVERYYALPSPGEIMLSCAWLNHEYVFTAADRRYVARVSGPTWRSASELLFELELLLHLEAHGVLVSAPVAASDGSLVQSLHLPEGRRYLVLFAYVDGTPLSSHSEDDMHLAGRVAAELHLASEGFASRRTRAPLDLRYLVDRSLRSIRPFLEEQPEDWSYLEGLARRISSRVAEAAADLEWGVCHGNFSTKKVHLGAGGAAVFDFDQCGFGWRAYDFASTCLIADFHSAPALGRAFQDGYLSRRKLRQTDVKAIPLFHALAKIFYLGLECADHAHAGAGGVRKSKRLALEFLRRWDEEHLDRRAARATSRRNGRRPGNVAGPAPPPQVAVARRGKVAVVRSLFGADALASTISGRYGFAPPVSCRLLDRGVNDTYEVRTGSDRFVARVYREGWRSPPAISYELRLLAHLDRKGVSVPVPVPGSDGELFSVLDSPEGRRYLTVCTYISGSRLVWTDDRHIRLAGELAGRVHGCSDDFEERGERPPFDLDLLLDRPLAILVPVLGRASADSRDVSRIVGRLRRQLATAAENGLDWGPCHGDFSAGNFHLSDGDRVGIFDFDFCGPGWRSSDLAHVQWTALFQGRQSTWTSFLDGYVSTRPLRRPDIDAIPLFHVARRLYFLSLHLVNATAWGAGHNTGRYVRSEVAFFRSWEADELPAWIRG